MCKRFLLVVLALCLMSSVSSAISILLISDSGYIDEYGYMWFKDADGKDVAGGGKFVDSTLVRWLQNDLGYTVDMYGMQGTYRDNKATKWYEDAEKMQHIADADLIFVSKFAASNRYDGASDLKNAPVAMQDRYYWNTLEKPLISQSGHLAIGQDGIIAPYGTWPDPTQRWGWTNGGNNRNYCDTPTTATEMLWSVLKLDMNTQLFDWSTATGGVCPANDRPALPVGDWPDVAQLVGFYDDTWTDAEIEAVPARHDKPIVVDIPEGTDLDAFCNMPANIFGTTGGNRVLFGIWNYDGNAAYYWGQYLTATYKDLLAQTIAMKVPEPATIALLGLGGLALLRKKR